MRLFVLQNAAMFVRPNINKSGFEIKLRSRLGINYFTMGEFYARPGQIPDVEGDIIVDDYREQPNNVEVMPDHGVPIVYIEEPPQRPDDIVIVANPEDIVVAANPGDIIVDNNNEFVVIEAGPADPDLLPNNEQIIHNDSGIENNDEE